MVRDATLSKQQLEAASASERDALLAEAFDLSPATLAALRDMRVGNAVVEAAELLAARGFPRQTTTHNLAAILYEEWEKPNQYTSYISGALRRRYEDAQQAAETQYNLSPPYIHFLREEVGAYEGNLLAVRDQYPAFHPSDVDYTRSIRLPPEIDFEAARLIGTYAVNGAYQTNRGGRAVLRLQGSGIDWEWYECLTTAIQRVHNLNAGVVTHEEQSAGPDGDGAYTVRRPRIKLQSQAVTTWLQNDLGLDLTPPQRELPALDWPGDRQAHREGLLAGALAGMGRIHTGDRYEATRQTDQLVTDIAALAEQLDIKAVVRPATERPDATQLVFNQAAVAALADRDLFWNPRHQRALALT